MHVPNIINEGRISAFQYMVVVLCGLVMLIDGFDTQAISYMAPLMAKEWGISRHLLGPIFSSALVGLMVGYLALAPLSDRFGHRRVLIANTILFALFTGLTVLATNVTELIALRFLTGMGLGAAIPSAIALTSEYTLSVCVRRLSWLSIADSRSVSSSPALLPPRLLPAFGWRSLLWIGAGFPLGLAVLLLMLLPNSLDQLVRAGKNLDQVWMILRRIDRHLADTPMPAGFTTDQEGKIQCGRKRFQGWPNGGNAFALDYLRPQSGRVLCTTELASLHSDQPTLRVADGRDGDEPDYRRRDYCRVYRRARHGPRRSLRIVGVPLSRRRRVRCADWRHA